MKFLSIISIILFLFLFAACNSDGKSDKKSVEVKKTTDKTQDEFYEMRTSSNKLVFKLYYLDPDSNIFQSLSKFVWVDSTIESRKIESFNRLFVGIIDSGYCCCPNTQFSVSFYKDKKEIGFYNIDTSISKGKAIFYPNFYRYSYLINLNDWNSFLRENTNYVPAGMPRKNKKKATKTNKSK